MARSELQMVASVHQVANGMRATHYAEMVTERVGLPRRPRKNKLLVSFCLLTIVLTIGCDPYIFTIENGTERPIRSVLAYEEPLQHKGSQRLEPGERRTVGAWEFKESRFVRVEGYSIDGALVFCQRFDKNTLQKSDGRIQITDGAISCSPL